MKLVSFDSNICMYIYIYSVTLLLVVQGKCAFYFYFNFLYPIFSDFDLQFYPFTYKSSSLLHVQLFGSDEFCGYFVYFYEWFILAITTVD